jgi:hypothetical protein
VGFESGTEEGFHLLPESPAAQGALFTSSARSSSGTRSLAVRVAFPSTSDLTIAQNPCGDFRLGVDLFGKRLSARFFFEGPPIPPGMNGGQSTIAASGLEGELRSSPIVTAANQWQTLSVDLSGAAAHDIGELTLTLGIGASWAGTLYIDDVRFE